METIKKPTAKDLIISSLWDGQFCAIHEIAERIRAKDMRTVSENAISARLRELTQEGKLINRQRDGKPFKEWAIKTGQGVLFK